MKKVLIALLTLSLVLAMAVPVFAAGTVKSIKTDSSVCDIELVKVLGEPSDPLKYDDEHLFGAIKSSAPDTVVYDAPIDREVQVLFWLDNADDYANIIGIEVNGDFYGGQYPSWDSEGRFFDCSFQLKDYEGKDVVIKGVFNDGYTYSKAPAVAEEPTATPAATGVMSLAVVVLAGTTAVVIKKK